MYTTLISPRHATCPTHLILQNLFTRRIFGELYRSLNSTLCSFLHSLITSSLLGPNILLNTLISNILTLRSSVNVSDQASHPFKTTGKIVVLCIVIFKFLDIKLEDTQKTEPKTNNNIIIHAQNTTVVLPNVFWNGILHCW